MAALINGGGKLTYDDYIDIQIRSPGKQRTWFKMCYYNIPCNFMGCIEKKAKKNICFKRIYVNGMYPDGDCVSFSAAVYRYIKTGNGKILNYSLRNPQEIRQIGPYRLPSDFPYGNIQIQSRPYTTFCLFLRL